ncbi:hypothetical protein ACP26L_32120 [Paenibacillus sp. S-38]|uniref:hypothetical protein n=1 Tax=Paenibacillus sp. S-38 TaxID=3416710 RepID=UPI003CEEC841
MEEAEATHEIGATEVTEVTDDEAKVTGRGRGNGGDGGGRALVSWRSPVQLI